MPFLSKADEASRKPSEPRVARPVIRATEIRLQNASALPARQLPRQIPPTGGDYRRQNTGCQVSPACRACTGRRHKLCVTSAPEKPWPSALDGPVRRWPSASDGPVRQVEAMLCPRTSAQHGIILRQCVRFCRARHLLNSRGSSRLITRGLRLRTSHGRLLDRTTQLPRPP